MEIKEREWSSRRIFLRHLYFYQEKLRNGNIWAKHPGENLAALFFLFNYCFSCFEFPGCLFLHVLPRWLSHQSDFTGTSVQTNRSWVWKTLYSNLVTQMCVVQQWQGKTSDENRAEKSLQHTSEQNSDFSRARTGASGVPDKVTSQGRGNVHCFSFLFMSQHESPCLTYESVGVHVTFHLLCQLLPFDTYAERVNFLSFVQHLPLRILCVSITFYVVFRRKEQSEKSPL